jgi:hypothetical protein
MDQQAMGLVSLLYSCSIRIISEDVLESAEAGEILGASVVATCSACLRVRSSSEIHSAGVLIPASHTHGSDADSFGNQTRAECYARHQNPSLIGGVAAIATSTNLANPFTAVQVLVLWPDGRQPSTVL